MRITCIPIVITLAVSLVQADAGATTTLNDKLPRGVAPSRAKVYTPDTKGQWACLDGSKSIPFTAVNDDYCDCPDGSDEPGTSACGTGYFYCSNVGHTPAYIKTSRLNDGVCDPECCDGTDESDGQIQCPNVCEQVGAASRKERERLEKIYKEGNRIRKEYVAYGKSSKKKLQDQLDKLQADSSHVRQKAVDAKAALDAANAKLKEHLESTKLVREAARELQLAPLIEQQNERLAHATKIKVLFRTTLDELKEKHNKNYHDLAVKSTIAGYDEYLEDVKKEEEDEINKAQEAEKNEEEEAKEDLSALERMHAAQDATYDTRRDIGRMFQLIKEMKEKYNTEYNDEAVLKAIKVLDDFAPSWEDGVNEFVGEESIEIPDEDAPEKAEPKAQDKWALGEIYNQVQKGASKVGLGFLFKESKAGKSEVELAQEAYNKASEEERKSLNEIQKLEKKVQTDYGRDEAFAKLVDQCIEFKEIEYTYSVCLFGDAKQKSHSETSLGTFSSWVGDNYDTQLYTGGTKCWNGPERSVKVTMTCGTENKIVAVSEPSKCEYVFKMETPAVCQGLSESNNSDVHEAPYPGASVTSDKKHDEL